MVTIESADYVADRQQPRPASRISLPLPAFLRNFVRRRQERRTLVRLSRLNPRLVRDMGFDPERIYEALDGSWDEVDPGRFRIPD